MSIRINIVASEDKSVSRVNATGSVQHIITDAERRTFRLSDSQLKKAVNEYHGKRPNNAYLHSPTPWKDLYKRYNWEQVQTVLVVQKAEILSVRSKPLILKTEELSNSIGKRATFSTEISVEISNTASSSWTTGGALTIGQKFSYGVEFLGTGVGGETSLSYEQSWGIGGQESKTVTIGSTSGVSVELDPGETVIAELSASQGVMKVRIHYNAYLIGRTALNYNPKYKGHHFWGLGIRGVMSKAGISNSVKSTEDIEISYYANSRIALKDKKTKAVKATFSLADSHGE